MAIFRILKLFFYQAFNFLFDFHMRELKFLLFFSYALIQ